MQDHIKFRHKTARCMTCSNRLLHFGTAARGTTLVPGIQTYMYREHPLVPDKGPEISAIVNYHNWYENEPNNYQNNEDCVHITETSNKWNDRRCLTKETSSGIIMTALCQK